MASPVLRGGWIESDGDQRLGECLVRSATAGAKRKLPVVPICRMHFGLRRRANHLHISPRLLKNHRPVYFATRDPLSLDNTLRKASSQYLCRGPVIFPASSSRVLSISHRNPNRISRFK
jgi:hypothetical protein